MIANRTESNLPIAASSARRMSLGAWVILIVLLSLLAVAIFIAYLGWTFGDDASVPSSGYIAMAFGVIVSLGVGFGLMGLVFYSSRKGYDDPPVLLLPRDEAQDDG